MWTDPRALVTFATERYLNGTMPITPVNEEAWPAEASDSTPRITMASRLRGAISARELTLHFQPQFELTTGIARGMEVLSRWFPVGNAAIDPLLFIKLAEETGQIEMLGNWVMETACRQALDCCTSGPALTLCINLSPLQLKPSLVQTIQAILERTGFPAAQLELEITEGVLISDCALAARCLRRLKALGLQLAIDDFGVGYSNLSYLSQFPIDRLKLDKSLTQHRSCEWRKTTVLASVIKLCKALDISVIAEGVESEYQFRTLERLGCDQVQGFLLGRPAEMHETRLTMAKRWGERPPVVRANRSGGWALHAL